MMPDQIGAVADLLDDLVGDHAHAENSDDRDAGAALVSGREAEPGDPPVAGDHPPHPLPHHAGAHAVDDSEKRLLREHRGIERRDRSHLGLVAGHAAEVDLERGVGRGERRATATTVRRGSGTVAVRVAGRRRTHHLHRAHAPRPASRRPGSRAPRRVPPVAIRTRDPTPTAVRAAAVSPPAPSSPPALALLADPLLDQPPRLARRGLVRRGARGAERLLDPLPGLEQKGPRLLPACRSASLSRRASSASRAS